MSKFSNYDQTRPMNSQIGYAGTDSQFDGQFSTFTKPHQHPNNSEFANRKPEFGQERDVVASMAFGLAEPGAWNTKDLRNNGFTDDASQFGQKGPHSALNPSFNAQDPLTRDPRMMSNTGPFDRETPLQPTSALLSQQGQNFTSTNPGGVIGSGLNSNIQGSKLGKQAANREQDLVKSLVFAQKYLQTQLETPLGMPESLTDELRPLLREQSDLKSSQSNHQRNFKNETAIIATGFDPHVVARQQSLSRDLEIPDLGDQKKLADLGLHNLDDTGDHLMLRQPNTILQNDPFADLDQTGYQTLRNHQSGDFIDPRHLFKHQTTKNQQQVKSSALKSSGSGAYYSTQKSAQNIPSSPRSTRTPLKRLHLDNGEASMRTDKSPRLEMHHLHHYELATSSSQKKQQLLAKEEHKVKESNKHWSYPRFGNLKKTPAAFREPVDTGKPRVDSLQAVEQMHQTLRDAEAAYAHQNYMRMFPGRMQDTSSNNEPSLLSYYSKVTPTVKREHPPVVHIDLAPKPSSKRGQKAIGFSSKGNTQVQTASPRRSGRSPQPGPWTHTKRLDPNIDRLAAQLYTELKEVFQ